MRLFSTACAAAALAICANAAPGFLDDQFEMPPGFRIYRAAERDLTGGSYALRFDGQGRLLVGDGTALRRLADKDGDGVFDSYEVIATGLGWRGPQGILVYGDRLFVVGGDGIQLYEGYSTDGPLRHVGRVGAKLGTGGDHDSHTLLRGHDGYIYFMAGNGSGLTNRAHITESHSPALIEREASVYRISPDGKKWECIANGGRNPPSLGMNYLGDLFSFDSDMEWQVGLPWYRPVRLNQWLIGGDQGWQEVGAYPPYYVDNLPGILDVGRGSPNWGVFYEHIQLPERYKNAFLVCDYRWKSESTDDYRTSGRLVAFHLQKHESRWKAEMETLVRPKPNAKDAQGRAIPFALVDIDVAPDGSLYLTEHNQGVWRILYDPQKLRALPPTLVKPKSVSALDELLTLPQPAAEWSRLEAERILNRMPANPREHVMAFARLANSPLDRRLAAIRFLASDFEKVTFVKAMTADRKPEIRAQAAWLAGLRGGDDLDYVRVLLKDSDPFVRRRALEALTRHASMRFIDDLKTALADPDRTVRYAAMIVLSHLPTDSWFGRFDDSQNVQVVLRALTAAALRNDKPSAKAVQAITKRLTNLQEPKITTREDMLDLLRVLALYELEVKASGADQEVTFVRSIASNDPEISWERARFLGMYTDSLAVPSLVKPLLADKDPVRQFHFFQSLAKIPSGWSAANEAQVINWVVATQKGWFADLNSKGVEFPLFFQSALEEFASNHKAAVLAAADRIQYESLLGSALLGLIAENEPARLQSLYEENPAEAPRIKILQAMARVRSDETAAFLRRQLAIVESPLLRKAALASLKAMPSSPENDAFLKTPAPSNKPERPDAEIYNSLINASLDAGDAMRGRKIYERLLCNSCHAGGQTPGQEGRLFGPDLAGVTARMTRPELADAIVYPSKTVEDRFKPMAVSLKDGRELTGFVTERAADHVTFADATTVHRLAPAEILNIAPQQQSLMPEGLLRTLSDQEIAHLLKFLSTLGTAAKQPTP
jgi:putative heme-binding domain-containing protein